MPYKCKLISFGKINKYILLIFTAAVSGFFIVEFAPVEFSEKNSYEFFYFGNIIQTLFYSLGLTLSFSFYLIYILCNKRKKTLNKEKLALLYHFKKIKNISMIKRILWILLLSGIDFICHIMSFIIIVYIEFSLTFSIINIIFMNIFFYYTLKIKLYRHHYFSIITIGVIAVIIYLISFIFKVLKNNTFTYKEFFIHSFLVFLAVTFNYFIFVVSKYFMLKTYIRTYEIICFQGLIETVLSFILMAILIRYEIINDFGCYWEEIKNNGIKSILLILFDFCYYSQSFIINDIFTSYHVFLIDLVYMLILCINSVSKKYNLLHWLYILFLFICLLFVLVYIEIIELNFCGLSNMTRKNIQLRAQIDTDQNNDVDDNDDNRKNSVETSDGGYTIKFNNNKQIELNIFDKKTSNEE